MAVTAASDFEAGHVPAIDSVERLAAALGVPPWWIAYGDEGTAPFKERRPRDVLPPEDPTPADEWRIYRARHEGCAARVRQARENSGLSMRRLSDAAVISVQTWSNTEAGKTAPKVDSLERMAVALGVSPAWLAYGYEDEPQH
jgi:transcriptional regulator with XRE-family HTH domain